MTQTASNASGTARLPNPRRLLVAAFIGVALFCVTALFVLRDEEMLVLDAFVATPLFSLPLVIELWRQRQVRWLGGAFLVLGLTLFHFAAIRAADTIYHHGVVYWGECTTISGASRFPDPRAQQGCEDHAAAVRTHNAPRAGLAGGLIGAALSFGGLLLLGARFRTAKTIVVMLGATLVLGAIGAAGMSFTFPDIMHAHEWVLQIFLPWQSVFALTLVWLFGRRGPELEAPG